MTMCYYGFRINLCCLCSLLFISLNEYYIICNGAKLPEKTLGFYTLIADDTVKNYTSTANWQPYLLDYQMHVTLYVIFPRLEIV